MIKQFLKLKHIYRSICLMLLCGLAYNAAAQTSEPADAIKEIRQLAERYQSADRLSFDLVYKYATEKSPAVYLDSLNGRFKMHGRSYWSLLDSTESMVGKDYVVTLFREDRIMYLTKPSPMLGANSLLALPDSNQLKNPDVSYSVTETAGETKIQISFKPGAPYKSMEYYVSKKSGLITRIVNIVRADQLYDPSLRPAVDGSEYGVITVHFSNYKEKSFSSEELDTSRYFRKEGKEFVTTNAYQSYKIFLGNPNLQ